MRFARGAFRLGAVVVLAGALAACGSSGPKQVKDGNGGFLGIGGGKKAPKGTEIGVNSYLWRASLDVLKFMPLASADPYGGVIITDWYTDPQTPNERFKATAYILDTRLRADALNVTVFKQVNQGGTWVDAPTAAQTEVDMENAILDRARKLRLANIGEE
ncbi:DUF3576 domain-containing protein [Caulobacter sp. SLTY]|uniref:DUF3576 domain-containing protein n=1 Tax=Caulobacter sp. SLTY TaxID=2683262 RepID=UPI00141222AF|nr:DUF3576 domain-containing protein [Caulobacter sp. SLTY]NBB15677.1 DUF3576 domain-containing protein [Caulobacter sp. SLTY]